MARITRARLDARHSWGLPYLLVVPIVLPSLPSCLSAALFARLLLPRSSCPPRSCCPLLVESASKSKGRKRAGDIRHCRLQTCSKGR